MTDGKMTFTQSHTIWYVIFDIPARFDVILLR
jgi:hypothetical protein